MKILAHSGAGVLVQFESLQILDLKPCWPVGWVWCPPALLPQLLLLGLR